MRVNVKTFFLSFFLSLSVKLALQKVFQVYIVTEPAQKRRKSSTGSIKSSEEVKQYGSELVVYDKHNRCQLTDGEYELSLQEVQTSIRSSPKKHSSWETVPDINGCREPFETFMQGPKLKFRLSWTTEPSNGLVDRPMPIPPIPSGDNKENRSANGQFS